MDPRSEKTFRDAIQFIFSRRPSARLVHFKFKSRKIDPKQFKLTRRWFQIFRLTLGEFMQKLGASERWFGAAIAIAILIKGVVRVIGASGVSSENSVTF